MLELLCQLEVINIVVTFEIRTKYKDLQMPNDDNEKTKIVPIHHNQRYPHLLDP